MATTPLKYLNQYFTTILNVGGGLDNSQTTGIVIQSVSGLDITKPGVACLTYSDPINTSTAEWITYTSINGSNELQGVVRGTEGFSAKTHLNGAVVAFPLSESHINDINAMFDSTGLDIAQITTPANPDSGRNKLYFKSDDKAYTLTSAGVETTVATESYVSNVASADGWISAGETWAYASATTITVPSGAVAKYSKGDKIKLTQTTVKYFYIIGVADTVLTITGGTSYTLANATITNNYYSHQDSPVGFPSTFSYTSLWLAVSGTNPSIENGTITSTFWIKGGVCFFNISHTNGSSTTYGNGAIWYWSTPVTPSLTTPCIAAGDDTGLNPYNFIGSINTNSRIYLYTTAVPAVYVGYNTPITWGNTDVIRIGGNFNY